MGGKVVTPSGWDAAARRAGSRPRRAGQPPRQPGDVL